MTVLDDGYLYAVDCLEGGTCTLISFIHKEPGKSGKFVTVTDGTTNEELLQVLIHRLKYLDAKQSCRENRNALTHLESALLWLKERTRKRVEQNVENTLVAHKE